MNPLSKLPEEMDSLVNSFMTETIVGNTTVGFTQYIFFMLVAIAILLIVVFAFKKKQAKSIVPQGFFVNGMEYLVEFTRDDLCKGLLGDTWKKHFPFIAALFFFILFNNLLGIIPGAHPGTGTMGVTAALAIVSFIYYVAVGIKRQGVLGYLKSFAPAGLPGPMAAMVWLIELLSNILRPITLAIRLFCNMFAGHIVMGTFAILATLFVQPLLASFSAMAAGQAAVSIFWMLLLIIIYLVEMLVAVIQAYVFTLLSAVYIQLVESE